MEQPGGWEAGGPAAPPLHDEANQHGAAQPAPPRCQPQSQSGSRPPQPGLHERPGPGRGWVSGSGDRVGLGSSPPPISCTGKPLSQDSGLSCFKRKAARGLGSSLPFPSTASHYTVSVSSAVSPPVFQSSCKREGQQNGGRGLEGFPRCRFARLLPVDGGSVVPRVANSRLGGLIEIRERVRFGAGRDVSGV